MIIINSWIGRLGNNVIQLINAINIALNKKHKIINFPYHVMLTQSFINISTDCDDNTVISGTFFECCDTDIKNPNAIQSKNIALKYIRPILKIYKTNFYDNNYLCIHIRSGDIFCKNPHNLYVQPPYDYYKKIMMNYDKTILVYEDTLNPCINKLLNENIIFKHQSSSLIDDLSLLLNCENVAIGFGTFGNLIFLLSIVLKKIYIPDFYYDEKYFENFDVEIVKISLQDYIKVGEWKNTPEQQNFMLSYKLK